MSWEYLDHSTPTARKPHKCVWCGEEIAKGEKHTVVTGKMDGDFQANRFHTECDAAYQSISSDIEDGFDAYEFKRGTTQSK